MLSLALALSSPAHATLLINELLADPGNLNDANCDGGVSTMYDEFVEIVNTGATAVDMYNMTLYDFSSNIVRHAFPVGTVLPAGRAIVVYAGGTPSCNLPGVIVQVASTGFLGLNDTGDTIQLSHPTGVVESSYTYRSEANFDQSITYSPDLDPTNPMVQHTTISPARMSPGTKADGSAFSPPVVTTLSQPVPGRAGANNVWTLTNAAPNTAYVLIGSLVFGQTVVPACPNTPASMQAPQVYAQAVTNGQGAAQFSVAVPAAAAGRIVYVQAASAALCDISNLATSRF